MTTLTLQSNVAATKIRVDLQLIADMIRPGSRVLDIGCGDGALLDYLMQYKQVDGRGIELSQDGVNACVRNGLSVVQGDADTDLRDYPTNGFDIVVLSQTLQAVHDPRGVLLELVRIGRRAAVSFPNFGFWQIRWQLLLSGRMPVTGSLDQHWYETPNIHLCTVRDFVTLCDALGITIERSVALNRRGTVWPFGGMGRLANMLSEQAVFLLSRSPS